MLPAHGRNRPTRALIPVSTRRDVERGTLGNKLAVLSAVLPVAEPDLRWRLEATRQAMDGLESSKLALGNDVLNRAAEWTDARLRSETLKMAMRLRSAHLMVTNIRGPADPLYFLDATGRTVSAGLRGNRLGRRDPRPALPSQRAAQGLVKRAACTVLACSRNTLSVEIGGRPAVPRPSSCGS